jgi:predicted O-linked N-acetylglucosamine transferase (SPINDLY family)
MTVGFFCELHHTFGKDAEAVIFSTANCDDFITKTIRAVTKENFHAVGHLTDDELISFIDKQSIDYLIDLDGMIAGNRLHVILNQKAPVVKWVGGLIGSTYLQGIDYLITDWAQTPVELQADFTEELLIFDDSYVTYTPPPYKLEINAPPCLNTNQITFGCFNNGVKLTSKTIEVWAKILLNTENSTLILKDRAFDQKLAKNRILDLFTRVEIDPNRIHMLGGSSHREHLLAHHQVDICLDPLPYSGGLSTLEAAYMGVPVISRPGRLLAHRHSASHLKSLDCPELIAASEMEYVTLACDLAKEHGRIDQYRQTLRKNLYGGPLLNHEKFTHEFIKKLANR